MQLMRVAPTLVALVLALATVLATLTLTFAPSIVIKAGAVVSEHAPLKLLAPPKQVPTFPLPTAPLPPKSHLHLSFNMI